MAIRHAYLRASVVGAALLLPTGCANPRDMPEDSAGSVATEGLPSSDPGEDGAGETAAEEDGGERETRLDVEDGESTAAGDEGDDTCAGVSQEAEGRVAPADIIIVVDNSGSMNEETEWVADNLSGTGMVAEGFSQKIANSGIDYRVVLISATQKAAGPFQGADQNGICVEPPLGSGNCPDDDTNEPLFRHVDINVASTNALQIILDSQDQWSDMLREESNKHILVVSDDNSMVDARGFDNWVRATVPHFQEYQFHGIYSYSGRDQGQGCDPSDPCCQYAASEGTVYRELVDMTGGVSGNLCDQDFEPVFDTLATAVIEGSVLPCEWLLPDPPDGETLDPERVNVYADLDGMRDVVGQVEDLAGCDAVEHGWYFDDPLAPTRVLVCPQTCTDLQSNADSAVDIELGCKTVRAG